MGVTKELGTGLRYNQDKLRFDLQPQFATKEEIRVWTQGAKKYAPKNWEKGMSWSGVMASLKRHVSAWESGEDIDPEDGCYHTAKMSVNAKILTQYVKIYPQGDDRSHSYLQQRRIGLDIDEVVAGFVKGYMEWFGITETPEFWNFDPQLYVRLQGLPQYFWTSLEPLIFPSELTFEPACYITNRPIDSAITKSWLYDNKFPSVPVFTVKSPEEKIEIAKDCKLDIFVDDRFDTFVQMNKAGICCYLMDAAHNRRYNVGHKRIKSLSELTRY